MRSSLKKVNRKPLFKKRLIVEPVTRSTSDGRDEDASFVAAPDNKRSKIVGQDGDSERQERYDASAVGNGAISLMNERSTTKNVTETARSNLSKDSHPSRPSSSVDEASEKENPPNQLPINVKRKKSHKKVIRDVLDDDLFHNDILDDETMWISTSEKDDDKQGLQGGKSADIDGTVSKNVLTSHLNSFSNTSTPLRIPSRKNESLELFSSPKESPKHPEIENCKINEFGDSIIDYFNDDDSKLAALDVSDLISSHDSDKNSLKSGLGSKMLSAVKEKQVEIQQNHQEPLEKLSYPCESDNERTIIDSVSNKEELFYGLSLNVGNLIKKYKGIEKLYDWQNDCLNLPGLQKRQNLIYSLPTSGGKTLVAEILIMKELLCLQKDAMLILPFVSIVQEKMPLHPINMDDIDERQDAKC